MSSYDILCEDRLIEALKKNNGDEAQILSWEFKPEYMYSSPIMTFTKKDNYKCLVLCIKVEYEKNDQKGEDSYIVKVKFYRAGSSYTKMPLDMLTREIEVLDGVVGGMNAELIKRKLDPLKTPKILAQSMKAGREIMIFEDLRPQGFKKQDKMKGLDLDHAILAVKQMGRFHASSLFFEKFLPTKSIPESFNCVKGSWIRSDEEGLSALHKVCSSFAETTAKFLKNLDPKYENCSKWLLKHASKLGDYFIKEFEPLNNRFDVLIHGDCWTDNMLFKYNRDGFPTDFRFIEFQYSVKAPLASDLNYFLYTSLDGEFRSKYYRMLITTYHETFSAIIRNKDNEPIFSNSELQQELCKQKLSGLIHSMIGLRFTDTAHVVANQLEEFIKKSNEIFEKRITDGGSFKNRFTSAVDEMLKVIPIDED